MTSCPKTSFSRGLRERLFGKPDLSYVCSLEELQRSLVPGHLSLGVADNLKSIVSLEEPWLRRHLLISGQTGTGPNMLLEVILVQQILRGGALLLLDPWGHLRTNVERYVTFAQREGDFQALSLANPPAAVSALDENRVTYVPVPLLEDDEAASQAKVFFDFFWKAAAERLSSHDKKNPLLVVAPHAESLLDSSWSIRYAQGRAAGLTIVAHTTGHSALQRAPGDVGAAIMANSWTTVFFRQPTAPCLALATEAAMATGASSDVNAVREQLARLGLGEMLVARPGHLEKTRCWFLKS